MSDRVKDLEARVAELEAENAVLRHESSEYLRKWIAAQDLASWRHCLILAACQGTPTYPREDHGREAQAHHQGGAGGKDA